MSKHIIFLVLLGVILITTFATTRENFSPRREIYKRITKPVKRHINSKIDAFKNKITNLQNKYL